MSHCKHFAQMLTDYQEGLLPARAHNDVAEHLVECPSCADEERDLRRTAELLRAIPMPEPRLDLWREFTPKMAEVEAEMRLGPTARLSNWGHHVMSSIAEGMVLYTYVVAHRTLARMERYLIRDPFRVVE